MSDLISRQAAIDLISREETLTAFADYVGSGMSMDDYDALWDIVAKMPAVNPTKTSWIPVSERLPEKYTYTLWCASSGYVRSDYFNGEFWEDAKKLGYEVIAWMPLPKPYKPQERSGEE